MGKSLLIIKLSLFFHLVDARNYLQLLQKHYFNCTFTQFRNLIKLQATTVKQGE